MGLKSNILEIQVLLWLCPGCHSSEALVLALDTPLLLTTKDALFGIRIGVSLRGLWDMSSSDPRWTDRKKAPRKAHGEGGLLWTRPLKVGGLKVGGLTGLVDGCLERLEFENPCSHGPI